MRFYWILVGVVAWSGWTIEANGQQVDTYSPDGLREQAKAMVEKAKAGNGAASETLERYGVDSTMLSVRTKDGSAEVHAKFADIFVIVDGEATLLSGGEVENPVSSGAGESRGSAIVHGKAAKLVKGDIVHIPANTPHQLLLPKGGALIYFVVKVKEKD